MTKQELKPAVEKQKQEDEKKQRPPKYKRGDDGVLLPGVYDAASHDEHVALVNQFKASLGSTFGTEDDDLSGHLFSQVKRALPSQNNDEAGLNASLAMLHGIAPADELEGMQAVQMVAVHNMTMEMSRRAMIPDQTLEGMQECGKQVVKLARTFTAQMEALQKYRTKGQQTIQVQHIQVNAGAQAIVGNVKTGGRG